jgi:hypothetical protein
MSNPWFRLYAEFSNDPKVQILSEQDQRRLIMVFCMRCNGDVTLQDKHVTFQLRITPQEWATTKSEFIANGFIDSDNNVLNWDKRQFISDTSKDRVAKHRALHNDVTVTTCNVTVTPPEQIQNRTDTEQKHKNTTLATLIELNINECIAQDWITHRKSKKAPITKTVINGFQREADIAGISLENALRISCERDWKGFKAEWLKSTQFNGHQSKDDRSKEAADLLTGRKQNVTTFLD